MMLQIAIINGINKTTKEISCCCVKSPLKSFVKKSKFQIVIFAINFVAMNGHTYKLLKKTTLFSDCSNRGKMGDK